MSVVPGHVGVRDNKTAGRLPSNTEIQGTVMVDRNDILTILLKTLQQDGEIKSEDNICIK